MNNDLRRLQDLCQEIDSFGVILDEILGDHDLTQTLLAKRLNYSVSHINRMAKDQLPDSMHLADVRRMAEAIGCSEQDWARLALAFTCHILAKKGLLGL